MKKLKLRALKLGAREVLTRAQLKNVFGGSGSGSGSGDPKDCPENACQTSSDCSSGQHCTTDNCPKAPGYTYNHCH